MNDTILIILGMTFVTYFPRLIPFLLMSNTKIHKRINAFLECIPVVAIGALIIPNVFNSIPEMPLAALTGIGFTIFYGFLKGGIIIPVLGSVVITYLVLLLN